ncbi:PREDICTED: hexamerin [Ceratosolen solmsi marchali]|uniref:Hexamerin n=1 Tax=Ceratosolen solmsi marchali TaxID=326594 RepID=A0AAJ6VNE1_9HYME|nr:PREDICTED: hexamerin [Ceratosolen solmsi marchali]
MISSSNQDLLRKQQNIIDLLENIYGELPNTVLKDVGTSYEFESQLQNYENPSLVKYYASLIKNGQTQPKGTPFAASVSQLRKEVAILTQIFLGAKDYRTFLNTAAWARINVNEDQFVTAFSSAVLQLPYMNGVILPPVYEVYPQYFFDARIIQNVYNHVSNYNSEASEAKDQSGVYDINVNYTSNTPYGENQIAYFTDDIGLSAYYYYVQLASYMLPQDYSASNNKQGIFQGEGRNTVGHGAHYYYIHQQLLARYNLERLGQGLSPIGELDSYYEHIETPYKPNLRYSNGVNLPERNEHIVITPKHKNYNLVRLVSSLEQRILDAINLGQVVTSQGNYISLYQPQGLNILGELIEGTGRSINPRYYGSFQTISRQLFGNAPQFNNIYEYSPSALELGQTAVRDPVFYQLYNKIVQLFHYYQEALPAYQYNDVVVPGVNIQKIDMSDLVTYFSNYDVSLDNAVPQTLPHKSTESQSPSKYTAHLKRLDHKQYQYSIYVNSQNVIPGAVVRVYMGPKYNYAGQPIDVSADRHYFYELDQFFYDLAEGQNVIVRNSQEATGQSFDFPSFQQIKNQIYSAVRSESPYYVNYAEQLYGFPARLSLPKGSKSGFPLQLLVIISSGNQVKQQAEFYGPVVEEEFMTYQPQHYQIVERGEYQGNVRNQDRNSNVYQTTEVIPEFEGPILSKGNSYSDYLYKKYPGSYNYQHGQQTYTNVAAPNQQQGYNGYRSGDKGINYERAVNSYEQHSQDDTDDYYSNQGASYNQGQSSSYGIGQGQAEYPTGKVQRFQPFRSTESSQNQGGYQSRGTVDNSRSGRTTTYSPNTYQNNKGHEQYYRNYYQNNYIGNIIGGAVSLDGRPLGYPLDKQLAYSAFDAQNIYIQDVVVYHNDEYLPQN